MLLDPQDASRLRDVVAYGEKVRSMMDGLSCEAFLADTRTFGFLIV